VATLTQWTLPLNAPNPYPFYLQFISEEQRSKLFYTKYIVGVIGELDVSAAIDNVREWVVPPQIYAPASWADLRGIVYGPRKRVWFTMELSHRLVEFDPATGLFTAYGGPNYPVHYPRHLMFERSGAVWYTGAGTNGALIGRLNRTRTAATYWDLPIDLLTPEGLWVQSDGKVVWLTPINTNAWMTGAFLARLEVATGQLTYWTYPPPGLLPENAGVAGWPRQKPTDIWFSYDESGAGSRVFRLNLPTGALYEYAPPAGASSPRRFALDQNGNAWISDLRGRVSRITRTANCGTTKLVAHTVTVQPTQKPVSSKQGKARPAVHSVTPTKQTVTPVKSRCQADFPLPYPLWSYGIQASTNAAGQTSVYFTGSGIVIGRLEP
jgi:streptogramin lyase